MDISDSASYEAWYHTSRGHWIGDHEFALLQHLLQHLLQPKAGHSILDVGCGTGYFSCHFARSGLSVTGIDPDAKTLDFAKEQNGNIAYLQGSGLDLPFPDQSFDYSSAVTSLCFINDPQQVLAEMWRVTRYALVLGLLNYHSLLFFQKHGRGSYQGARWDTTNTVLKEWIPTLSSIPKTVITRTAIFFPQGNRIARWSEQLIPKQLPFGGFLAIYLRK